MAMKPLIVMTTLGAGPAATELARSIVESRLGACVNVLPGVISLYRWEGNVVSDEEQLLLIKTVEEKLPALRELIMSRHPYEVPEFVVLEISEMEARYREWFLASL